MSISNSAKRADHAKLRASLQEPVLIQGVWLDANAGRIRVYVEVDAVWCTILDLPNIPDGGHISHVVNPDGIRQSPPMPELG